MSKKSYIVVGIVLTITFAIGGWFWYESKAPVQQQAVPAIEEQEQSSTPLNLSWKRVDEIVAKIMASDSPDLPEGITQEEYNLAVKMKTAQLNHTVDGVKEPFRGEVIFVQPGDEWLNEFNKLKFPGHWEDRIYAFVYFDFDEGGNIIDKKIPLNFWPSKQCSLVKDSPIAFSIAGRDPKPSAYVQSSHLTMSCIDLLSRFSSAGGIGSAQVYGKINTKEGWIDVSKAVFGSMKEGLKLLTY